MGYEPQIMHCCLKAHFMSASGGDLRRPPYVRISVHADFLRHRHSQHVQHVGTGTKFGRAAACTGGSAATAA